MLEIKQSNKITAEEHRQVMEIYNDLEQQYLQSNHRKRIEKIRKAFKLAYEAHDGQKRNSGEPYILHPLAVAHICCSEMGLGSTSICSALLHDVVEDCDYTVDDIEAIFGKKIAQIVDGLTKISRDQIDPDLIQSMQAENMRKFLCTISNDVRVVLVKIADRLHNMRTLGSMRPAKQLKISGETQLIYAPLAERLGLFTIKTELEDLCFKYDHPQQYALIKASLRSTERDRQQLFELFASPIREKLDNMGVGYEIKARVKTPFSIWKKMEKDNLPIEEIYDIFAARIVFDSVNDTVDKNRCWEIYTTITELYKLNPKRNRDWISSPKSNGYQALHLTVMGPHGDWVEVQIRSRKMDDIAEQGLAAHWKYKGDNFEEDSEFDKWLKLIQEILKDPSSSSLEFIDYMTLLFKAEEINVFTPKGDLKKMPQGASVLDFAYSVHTEVGNQCIGARVNHNTVARSHILKSGDRVEILTASNQEPKPEWLSLVRTANAKQKIDMYLRRKRNQLLNNGRSLLDVCLLDPPYEILHSDKERLSKYFGFMDLEEFYYSLGLKSVTLPDDLYGLIQSVKRDSNESAFVVLPRVKGEVLEKLESKKLDPASLGQLKVDNKKTYLLTETEYARNYIPATCCMPIPGDDAFGYVRDGVLEVHKRNCANANRLKSLFGEQIVSTQWAHHGFSSFEAFIHLKGIDAPGVIYAITKIISEEIKLDISDLRAKAKDGIFEGTIGVMVNNVGEINNVCAALRKHPGIESAGRVATD